VQGEARRRRRAAQGCNDASERRQAVHDRDVDGRLLAAELLVEQARGPFVSLTDAGREDQNAGRLRDD
jgi:hypothetical protein